MVKKNARNIMIALVLVVAATILLQVVQPGGFSVIGSNGGFDEYAINDGNDGEFDQFDDARCYNGADECEPAAFFVPNQNGCSVVDVDSISTAAEELGVDAYFALTAEKSLTEINGVVYACE